MDLGLRRYFCLPEKIYIWVIKVSFMIFTTASQFTLLIHIKRQSVYSQNVTPLIKDDIRTFFRCFLSIFFQTPKIVELVANLSSTRRLIALSAKYRNIFRSSPVFPKIYLKRLIDELVITKVARGMFQGYGSS